MKNILNIFLNLIFPERCFKCGKENILLCADCAKRIPGPEERDRYILSAVSYKSPAVKKAIRALKYKKAKKVSAPLADLIVDRIKLNTDKQNALLIPAPLSKKRLRRRGFNQAELIARNLSDIWDIKTKNNVLYKIKDTISQVKIRNRKDRLENLIETFCVKDITAVKGKTIFVVDDVSTTGATIKEARRALKKAGAKKVIGLVVAS